ncbi:MAG: hypothetical protein ACKOQ3_05575 [Novosphingobium sp.]
MHEKAGNKANIAIHLIWIVTILVLFIIALIVWNPDSTIIYNYISFASAISSILLAVVAIIYSMISNRSFDSSIAEIRSSAEKIVVETKRLNEASVGLSSDAHDALNRLSNLPDAFQNMSGEISKKFEEISFPKPSSPLDSSYVPEPNIFNPAGKPLGMIGALYCLHLSYTQTDSFDLKEVFSGEDFEAMKSYVTGFIESFKNFNNCQVEIEGINGVYIARSLGKLDLSYMNKRISEGGDEDQFISVFNKIRKYFDVSPLINSESEPLINSDHIDED